MLQLTAGMNLSAKSEPDQEKKLYLRDATFLDLFPTESNIRLKAGEPHGEGSAAPFLKELWKRLNMPLSPERQEKILLKEIILFLRNEGLCRLAKVIKSTEDFKQMAPPELQNSFEEKDWHFNISNIVGGTNDYKLLCLGPRDKNDDPIADFCNKVGNSLSYDLLYAHFCGMVFQKLLWDDTEYEGFKKVIEIKRHYYPKLKDLIIPWVLYEWTTYKNELYKYEKLIQLHCELWDEFQKGVMFPELLSRIIKRKEYAWIWIECDSVEHDFNCIMDYVSKRSHEHVWGKSAEFQIEEYFEKLKPVTCMDKGYRFHVIKKIIKAVQLGIIKKEEVEGYEEVERFLKTS